MSRRHLIKLANRRFIEGIAAQGTPQLKVAIVAHPGQVTARALRQHDGDSARQLVAGRLDVTWISPRGAQPRTCVNDHARIAGRCDIVSILALRILPARENLQSGKVLKIRAMRASAVPINATLRNAVFDQGETTTAVVAVFPDVTRGGKPVLGDTFNAVGHSNPG